MRRLALPLLLVPLVLSAWGSRALADALGRSGGAWLSDAAWPFRSAVPDAVRAPTQAPVDTLAFDLPLASGAHPGKPARAVSPRPLRAGLRISALQVLRLVERGAMPRGTPVVVTPLHPAGLALSGVSALGVGLRDGDVLTEAAGSPALSIGAVVQAVIAARARHAPAISGRCFREGQSFQISVEQPYLGLSGASAPKLGGLAEPLGPRRLDEQG